MSNDGLSKVVGIGTICLETSNGTKLILKDVRHAPDIKLHLISTSKFDDNGYCTMLCDGQLRLTKGSLIVARSKKSSGLYWLQASVCNGLVNAVEIDRFSELWHKRLSRISEKRLNCLAKKNMLSGLKGAKLDKCEHCLVGKQRRVSFKHHGPSRKAELLELVHSDVCGPLKVKTFSGGLYFVTFIDDHSRKLWVKVLKSKDQVVDAFIEFHVAVERETGKKLKCIRTDNGGEYCGPPKTPQLNGLAERMNITVVERVRCLLSDAKLSRSFWGEALYTVAHVINLTPTVVLNADVPDRVWYGRDVSYDHLRVFGCNIFVHVP